MRGYFGIGVEQISKPGNLGNLMRSAHAFGASFFFAVAPALPLRDVKRTDTSDATQHLPTYTYGSVAELALPKGCRLVGVELTDDAEELPSFFHPTAAAYVLGPERGSLSPELHARCDHLVQIPTRFCINLAIAGAIVMYDRQIAQGRFARRAVGTRGGAEPLSPHIHGSPLIRSNGGDS